MPRIDVVCVPDFSTPANVITFEWQVLLFLTSWLQNAGPARDFPLHLACIGEPPASVRALGDHCGARITVHAPVEGVLPSAFPNKLRAFEIARETEFLLLLDADILFLGDFSTLPEEVDGSIAVARVGSRWVPEDDWRRIYARIGLDLPATRVCSLATELGVPIKPAMAPEQISRGDQMLPHFNGGVIFTPWSVSLQNTWREHMEQIPGLFPADYPLWRQVVMSDQIGLATAIQQLVASGHAFKALPEGYNARLIHLARRRLPWRDVRLFHAIGFARPNIRRGSLSAEIGRYARLCARRLLSIQRDRLREHPTDILSLAADALAGQLNVLRLFRALSLAATPIDVDRRAGVLAQQGAPDEAHGPT